MNEAWIMEMRAALLAIECEMQAMIAENTQRAVSDHSPAYGEDAFTALAERAEGLADVIHGARQ